MSETEALDALGALVRDSAVSGVERQVLLLRTDALPPALSKPHHLRLAREAMDTLVLADRGRRHALANGRIAVSWRGDSPALLQEAFERLDTLLQDAPLEAPGLPELISHYALPAQGAALLREAGVEIAVETASAPTFVERAEPEPPPPPALDTPSLERLEERLGAADLSRFARRRPVCRLQPAGMRQAWEERFLSVPELIGAVAPGYDVKADPWLFRRLTRVLDRRMLSILSDAAEVRGAGPFSITLNVASVLGPEFLRFDATLPSALRDRIMIAMLPADVAADAGAFAFARNFARARSYRLCLRAVTAGLLPVLDLPAMELDFVQLVPSAELLSLSALPSAGSARWVLGRPCDDAAVEWGKRIGIGLFAATPSA